MTSHDTIDTKQYYRSLLDAIPMPILVVDEDVRIMDFNKAAVTMLGDPSEFVFQRRGGEVLHCIHSTDVSEGCGHGPHCSTCIMRNSVNESILGKNIHRQRTTIQLVAGDAVNEIDMLVTTAPIPGLEKRVLLILEDISELTKLRTLIPMCSKCRRIRNDQQYWQSIEEYFRKYLGVVVSHGLCQESLKELYPEYSEQILKKLGKS